MHNTWLIIRREYLERIRSKAFIIMTMLMPVFMASTILIPAMLSGMKSGGTRRIVLVVNNPEVAEAVKQQLIAPQSSPPDDKAKSAPKEKPSAPRYDITIDTNTSDAERTALRQQISDGKIDGFLWLSDNDLAGRKVVYNAKDVTDFGESIELRNAIQTALTKRQLAQKGMSGAEVENLLKPIDMDSIRIDKGKEGASGISVFLVSFTMVMLLYVNMLVYGFAVMRSIIEEKSSRILEVLLSSVTSKQLLAGKIIGVGAVGLTQTLIWLLVALAFSLPGLLASRSILSNVQIPMAGVVAFAVFRLFPLCHDVCGTRLDGEFRPGGPAGAVAGHAAYHLLDCVEHAGAAAPQLITRVLDVDGALLRTDLDVRARDGRNATSMADHFVRRADASYDVGNAWIVVTYLSRRHSDVWKTPDAAGVAEMAEVLGVRKVLVVSG
jgi:ABC-2 type transport system permease protein